MAHSEDPDEMQHNAAFHQGLHYLHNGQSLTYCVYMYGEIHQNTKGSIGIGK